MKLNQRVDLVLFNHHANPVKTICHLTVQIRFVLTYRKEKSYALFPIDQPSKDCVLCFGSCEGILALSHDTKKSWRQTNAPKFSIQRKIAEGEYSQIGKASHCGCEYCRFKSDYSPKTSFARDTVPFLLVCGHLWPASKSGLMCMRVYSVVLWAHY